MSAGESFGSSLHNTLRKFGLLEMTHQRPKEKGQLVLFTEDHHHAIPELSVTTLLSLWRESFIAEGYESKKTMLLKFAEGEDALKKFHTWWAKEQREVVAIEKGFTLDIESGITLSGRFDRVERTPKGLRIIDFKSTAPRTEAALRDDLQLSLYARAALSIWGEPIESLTILSVRNDGVTEQRTTRSEADITAALKTVRETANHIGKEEFTATPSPHVCALCPFRGICGFKASTPTSEGASAG